MVLTNLNKKFPYEPEFLQATKEVLESMKNAVKNNPDMFGSEIKEIVTLDGMRIVFKGGFALIRQSNTEPVFTLRFEAPNEELCNKYKEAMVNYIDNCVKQLA